MHPPGPEAPLADYYLQTMGNLAVNSKTGVVDFPIGKPLALLVRLVCCAEAPTRRELCQLLWPRATPERALQSVRQALWLIRRSLGDVIITDGERVIVDSALISSDLDRFNEALAEGRLDEANGLWQGPFADRLVLSDAAQWDHWVDEIREDMSSRLAAAAHDRAIREQGEGNAVAARRWLERTVQVAPEKAEYRRELIQFLVDTRDLNAADAAMCDALAVLSGHEHGPFEDLQRRVAELRADHSASSADALANPELVGRSNQLADLLSLWRRARTGQRRLAFLTGPPGIGKTRLANELASNVRHDGGRALVVRSTEAERGISYGLVGSLARGLLLMPGSAGVTSASDVVLRRLNPSLDNLDPPDSGYGPHAENGGSATLADALMDLIDAVAYESPLLIVLDDANLADAASLTILARTVRLLRESPVLFLVTARTIRRRDSSTLEGLRSAVDEPARTMLRLRSLTPTETSELAGLIVELPNAPGVDRLLERIHVFTGGIPFFVIEIIRLFLANGLIRRTGDRLILSPDSFKQDIDWPPGLRSLVRQRLKRLSEPARVIAHAMAVSRSHLPDTATRRVTGLTRSAYTQGVATLQEHGIVRWLEGKLEFTHDWLQEAAEELGDDSAGDRERSGIRWPVSVGAAAVFVITTGLLGWLIAMARQSGNAAPDPFGGGEIAIVSGDSLILVRAVMAEDSVTWHYGAAEFPVPDISRVRPPFVTVSGNHIWLHNTRTPDRGPDIVRLDPRTGDTTTIIARPGDDGARTLSPDGEWVLFGSDLPGLPYDPGIHIARLDGSDVRVVTWGRLALDWSRDGRFILGLGRGPQDTLFVMTPAGSIVASRVSAPIQDLAYWCGDSQHAVFTQRADVASDLVLWDWTTGEETVVMDSAAALLGCSPNGRGVIVARLRSLRLTLGILDVRTGRFHDLGLEPGSVARGWGSIWLAPPGNPIPARLQLALGDTRLKGGERVRIDAAATASDGSAVLVPIEWSSSDRSVATVTREGVVVGNREGSATIAGCLHGWICDDVRVTVLESATTDLLLETDFTTDLDTTRWAVRGDPAPIVEMSEDGEPALHLRGDGVWADGIISRLPFSLQAGGVVELDVRMPVTRSSQQRFVLCLSRYSGQHDLGSSADDGVAGRVEEGVCVQYPAEELARFDERQLMFARTPNGGYTARIATIQDALPPDDWTHIAIQMEPDGHASLFVDHQFRTSLLVPVDISNTNDWRIEITGHDVDTRLEIRNLRLWSGSLYEVERDPIPNGQ